jgi:hypothetical protein
MAQAYPTYNRNRAALVEAMIENPKARRADQLKRGPIYQQPGQQPASAAAPSLPPSVAEPVPVPVDRPAGGRLPGYTRPPDADERLTGEGGAELGARKVYPTYSPPSSAKVEAAPGEPASLESSAVPGVRRYPTYSRGPAAQHLDDLVNTKATDANGRLRSGAKTALLAPTQPTDSLGNALGQLLGSFVAGAAVPSTDEELIRQRDIVRAAPAAQREAAEEDRRMKSEDAASQIAYRDSMTDYNNTTRKDEATARAEDKAKQRLITELRTKQSVDPSKDSVFLNRWQKLFGDPFNVDSWNNKKGNFTIRGVVTDPSRPQEQHDVAYNFATGETKDLGLSDYVTPRDTQGMSENERRVDSDRDRGYSALERQRSISNDLQRVGLSISKGHLDLANLSRDDRLSENTRKEIGAAAKLRADAEQQQMDAEAFKGAGMYQGDDGQQHQAKWAAQKWKAAEDKAEALRREYFSTYGYLHAPDGGEIKMSTGEFRQLFPNAPNPSASAPSYGVVLTDSDQPGTPQTNTYAPRRPTPRAPSSAAPSAAAPAQSKGRVSRSNFDKVRAQNPHLKNASDAEVESALRAQGIEVY